MSLQEEIMNALKAAMKDKDQTALAALRAIKSEILLAQTESGSKEELTKDKEIKILSKLVKQRKDSAAIFAQQNRNDLAEPELAQINVIAQFLPEQMSEQDLKSIVVEIIEKVGATSMKDMGKVMGWLKANYDGQYDGKTASTIIKAALQS